MLRMSYNVGLAIYPSIVCFYQKTFCCNAFWICPLEGKKISKVCNLNLLSFWPNCKKRKGKTTILKSLKIIHKRKEISLYKQCYIVVQLCIYAWQHKQHKYMICKNVIWYLATVPLTIFRSNSKFDQILQCSGLKCTLPITTKFCTRHDSVTVVTCAKFLCDWYGIF